MTRPKTANGTPVILDRRFDHRVPVVYFGLFDMPETVGGPRIKIGETDQQWKRFSQLAKSQFGFDPKFSPICSVRGTPADEKQVQRYFDKHRIAGEEETFWPDESLTDYIRWLRDQWYVWVPDDEHCRPIDELDTVDSSLWMPDLSRRKKAPVPPGGLFGTPDNLDFPPREITIDDFYTSEIIIEAARNTLGKIDLDPASHAVANRVVRARRFFNTADDGLVREWSGRVWLNPPFSQWKEWASKIASEWQSGRITAMCVLCATRTLTAQYLGDVHSHCSGVCILRGRIAFWGGRATTSPDDGHAVFYFGHDEIAFGREFSKIGFVYGRVLTLTPAALPA